MLSNHHHHVHASFRFKSEFSQVFAFRTVRALGASIVSVFIPIYLYEISDNELKALSLISLYFSLQFIVRALMTVPVANLVHRFGGKHVLLASAFFDVLSLGFLISIERSFFFVGAVSVAHGLASALFFTALHIELSKSIGKKATHNVGSVEIARKITMALGPLFGGVIAGYFGFSYAAIIAAIIILFGCIFLHLSKEPLKNSKRVNPALVRRYLSSDPSCRANFGMAINTASAALIWPLFIYIFLNSYQNVGLVVSASLVIALVIMLFVRNKEAASSIEKEIKIGGRGGSLVHTLRGFAVTPFLITIINIANDVFVAVFHVPYIAQYYANASRNHRSAYISAMEISYSIGVVSVWPVLLGVFLLTNNIRMAMVACFFFGAIGVLYSRNIQNHEQ